MSKYEEELTKKLHSVYTLHPTSLGNMQLTNMYKFFTSRLKIAPFFYIIPISFLTSLFLYAFLGESIVKIASLLQHGF